MARQGISIDEKIKKQKEVVVATKDKYDAAVNQLKLLIKKKQDLQGKELLNAFVNSDKSLDEILAFMSGKKDDES
jgi:Na+-translocating ferredoxin:NAD+ oxidoreductase RnfC subunit